MNTRLTLAAAVFVAASGALHLGSGTTFASDEKSMGQTTEKMDPMMEAWMKFANPGEKHKLLDPMVGSWNVTTTMWMAPGAPPSTSGGTCENSWILGGRYVMSSFKGEFMGQPFEGIGYNGYDNYRKRFIGTWMDSASTFIMVSDGDVDASGRVFTFTADYDDVMTGKKCTMREIVTIVDANKHVFEMYQPDPTGKEFKGMEIVYTRK